VIATADAPILYPAELERDAAMRAIALQQCKAVVMGAEEDQVLAQQLHRHRRLLDLLGESDRPPVTAKHLAARGAGPDAGQKLVFFRAHIHSLLEMYGAKTIG
jgi:hypothetical protein